MKKKTSSLLARVGLAVTMIFTCAQGLILSTNVRAANGDTVRVSVNSSGSEANGASEYPALSTDGHYVVFNSFAANLVPGDSNGLVDIFVRDLQTGMTELVSVDVNGLPADGPSRFNSSISSDGRYVAFQSDAIDLVLGDTNGVTDIFVRDRQTDTTERVSVDSSGNEGDGFSAHPAISADGRYVVFYSDATNLILDDTNGWHDVFVHDRQTGVTERVSVASSGTEANGSSSEPSISADGGFVAFHSGADNLVLGDTNVKWDVFLHNRMTDTTTRISLASGGAEGNNDSYGPSLSGDGRYIAFYSLASNLAPDDTNLTWDVFRHDSQTGATVRISRGLASMETDGESSHASISADGRHIVFLSYATNLASDDTNGMVDIFTHDMQTQTTFIVSLISNGQQANSHSIHSAVSSDGHFIAFDSDATNLVLGDGNGVSDVFFHEQFVIPPVTQQATTAPPQTGPTFLVNTIADSDDNSCDVFNQGIGNKDCTLREAINASNMMSGANTIIFDNGLGAITITLNSQLPAVTSPLEINGNGTTNAILQANSASNTANYRVLEVGDTGDLTINHLTVRNGRCNGACNVYAYNAGGILNRGTLTIANSTLSGNTSTFGGGIASVSWGTLTITDSIITGNSATYGGGAINEGLMTVTNSTFSSNSAPGNGGGGIYNQFGTLEIINSTFSSNSALSIGGGVVNSGGVLNLTNSTFSANSAIFGGGVYNSGTLTITSSTFSGNSAGSMGGGIVNEDALNVYNSIITNSASGGDCRNNTGSVTGNNNLIEGTGSDACNLTDGVNGNIVGADPDLGTLTGSPAYFPLNSGSLAMDAGDDSICAASPVNNLDQRGVTRPQGAHCDIGAYEAINTPAGSNIQVQPVDTTTGTTPVTLTFSQITQSGGSSLTTSSSGPPPPAGFRLSDPPMYYELTTTAVFSGTITLCIDYTGTALEDDPDEDTFKLYHMEGGIWEDRTASLDPVNDIICASVSSLSPFAIFESAYQFRGFFPPVDNIPTLNLVNGGRAIPVKFSLGAEQGLNVFAAGYPKSQQISCDSAAPVDGIEETVTAGSSSLSYDPTTDQYTYVWKTQKSWAGMCHQLILRFADGTVQRANFQFK
jgi:CSLREA domain-containing protein